MNALQRDLKRMVDFVEINNFPIVKQDPHRQKFHLMPPVGWLNDPNGLCWYKGKYHVYYQYAPFDVNGGVKFWGHWSSPDLLEWNQEPVFMCPDQTFNIHGVYSGSALVENDELYLYYTGNVKHPGNHDYIKTGRGHNTAVAISKDGNVVSENILLMENSDYPKDVTCHVRDPKVWKQDGKYYMILGARTVEDRGEVLIYESEDKLKWSHINTITTPEVFGYMWECPDLFCIDGQYILAVSPQGVENKEYEFQNVYSCGYFPLYGDFRGECTLGEYRELDKGFDFYAQQTFQDKEGRCLAIGWMGMPDAAYTNPSAKDFGWQHCMTVPRELKWNGKYLLSMPVKELEQLRVKEQVVEVKNKITYKLETCADIEFENKSDKFEIAFGDCAKIVYENKVLTLSFTEESGYGRDKRRVKVDKLNNIRILVDTSSLEIFINQGEEVMSNRYYPSENIELKIQGIGISKIYDMKAMEMTFINEK